MAPLAHWVPVLCLPVRNPERERSATIMLRIAMGGRAIASVMDVARINRPLTPRPRYLAILVVTWGKHVVYSHGREE